MNRCIETYPSLYALSLKLSPPQSVCQSAISVSHTSVYIIIMSVFISIGTTSLSQNADNSCGRYVRKDYTVHKIGIAYLQNGTRTL